MNFFTCINEALKTVHKNYQLLIIHFLFLFVSFFGLFFILSIPLGILFVVFEIDLTDILRGSFFEIVSSSIKLLKKFLIFAIIFLLTLLIYVVFVVSLWFYIFSGTIGIMSQYLQERKSFNFKDFHRYGKQFFWKIAFFTIFSVVVFIFLTVLFGFISETNSKIVNFIEHYSHTLSVFFNVFLYLIILITGIAVFILWITYTLFGFFGIFIKNLTVRETIKKTGKFIVENPNCLGRAGLLFVIYVLIGGVILSFGSLLAIIPHIGPILLATYQFITQFAHIYITMTVFAAFLSYYLYIYPKVDVQEQVPLSEENQQQLQSLPPSEPS